MDLIFMSTALLPSRIFYPLIIIVAMLVAVHYWMQSRRIVKMGKKLPGPTPVPFFGNALTPLRFKPDDALYKLLKYEGYGNVIRAFFGTKCIVFIMDPRDVEIILSSPVHIDKAPEYRYFAPWLGDGLLISEGEKWRTHRKIIAPTFHLSVLKTFVPYFYEISRDCVDRLRSEVGREFDCHDLLSVVTVDILLATAMGVRGRNNKASFAYAQAVMKMCDVVYQRLYKVHHRLDSLFKFSNNFKIQKNLLSTIHGLTSSVIRTKKQEYLDKGDKSVTISSTESADKSKDNKKPISAINIKSNQEEMQYVRDDLDEIDENDIGEKKRLAFLDLLLEMERNGGTLTAQEVKDEVDTIMFEGHDTTAAASSFVLCLLGAHQDIQARVYAEINGIFKGSDRQCTFQDTMEMTYLHRVIMETIRLFPPVPAIARQLNEDVRLASGDYVVPRGSTVIIPPYKIHRLKEYYNNPEVFNPDNFLPEVTQNRHYYAFIPFSAGPRSCVGRKYAMLKLKVLLSTILRNYKIVSDLTESDFRLQVDIILKRSDGFRINIEPRRMSTVVA